MSEVPAIHRQADSKSDGPHDQTADDSCSTVLPDLFVEREKGSHHKQVEYAYDPFANHPSVISVDTGDYCDQRHFIYPGPSQVMAEYKSQQRAGMHRKRAIQ